MSKTGWRKMVIVGLACGHNIELEVPVPEPGALQYCRACDDWRIVESVPKPWLVRCATKRNCYDMVCADYETAKRRVKTHSVNQPNHVIRVLYSFSVVAEYAGMADGYIERPTLDRALTESEAGRNGK